jgi:AraC-like DNA-binding protein
MRLTTIRPHPRIAAWVHHFWIFEAEGGLPIGDQRIVVPNGRPKLIVTWRNGLSTFSEFGESHTPQGEIVLIGVWDRPTVLSSTPEPTITIGVEFRPNGLTRFVPEDLSRLRNMIVPLEAVLNSRARLVQARINAAETVGEAAGRLENYLLERLIEGETRDHRLLDAILARIADDDYPATITDLSGELGYSRRHIQEICLRGVGLTPKRLQSVLGFERLYKRYSQTGDTRLLRQEALDRYHDQAHFIRSFRTFTGFSPARFGQLQNEFGKIFYRSR